MRVQESLEYPQAILTYIHQWNYGGIMVGIGFVVFVLCAIGGSITFKGKKERRMTKVTWFDNYWGWLERLVKKCVEEDKL